MVNAVVLVATGVDGDGHRKVLGVKVATSETKEAWNVLFADLVARGLTGVKLVKQRRARRPVEAIAANPPGAAWLRCRTHYAANLMSITPKSAWPAVKTMLHSVYDQPDAEAVHAPGTGKTFLLEALGQQAVEAGLKVAWFTLEDLGVLLRRHRADDTVPKAIARVLRADLVVVDDIGPLPVAQHAAEGLYRLVDAAYEKRSVAVSSICTRTRSTS